MNTNSNPDKLNLFFFWKKVKQAEGLAFLNQAQKDSHVDNNYKLQCHNLNMQVHPTDTTYEQVAGAGFRGPILNHKIPRWPPWHQNRCPYHICG